LIRLHINAPQEQCIFLQVETALREAEESGRDKDKKILDLQQHMAATASENNALSKKCESDRKSLVKRCAMLEAHQRDEAEENRLKASLSNFETECQALREKLASLESSQEARKDAAERCKERADALTTERDMLLLRNASLSQQGELACRQLQEEISELKAHLDQQKQVRTR
jgi:hypothetical protein